MQLIVPQVVTCVVSGASYSHLYTRVVVEHTPVTGFVSMHPSLSSLQSGSVSNASQSLNVPVTSEQTKVSSQAQHAFVIGMPLIDRVSGPSTQVRGCVCEQPAMLASRVHWDSSRTSLTSVCVSGRRTTFGGSGSSGLSQRQSLANVRHAPLNAVSMHCDDSW